MKFFLSGYTGTRDDFGPVLAKQIKYRLLSMHDQYMDVAKLWTDLTHHPDSAMTELMLDSGAFTAFTRGVKVQLDELSARYDEVIRRAHSSIEHIWLINLDVIPGEWGRLPTASEIRQALDESDRNFVALRKRFGDRVLPVFHMTEPPSRLAEVLAQSDFIAIGLRQDQPEETRIECAREAAQAAHKRKKRIHGLATTGTRMLRAVPFDTVDSATWAYAGAMGELMFVDEAGGIQRIPISDRSPMQSKARGHYANLTKQEQQWITKRVEAAGFRIEQVITDHSMRKAFNAYETTRWLSDNYERPETRIEQGLFPMDAE